MLEPGLAGRVALVTGANNPRGIGAATARAFARQGAAVVFTAFGEPPARHVLEELRGAGGRALALDVDLADSNRIPELFDRAERELGPVEILVHNAAHSAFDTFLPAEHEGVGRPFRTWPPPPERVSAASHDDHFAVNSRATALLIGEFARRHLARGARWGRIITVTSDGQRGFPREISYGASKSALDSYTLSAARELAPFGITANAVRPPATQTGWITPEMEPEIARTNAFGRAGEPEEVADAIVFLASEQARLVTGQILVLGGERPAG